MTSDWIGEKKAQSKSKRGERGRSPRPRARNPKWDGGGGHDRKSFRLQYYPETDRGRVDTDDGRSETGVKVRSLRRRLGLAGGRADAAAVTKRGLLTLSLALLASSGITWLLLLEKKVLGVLSSHLSLENHYSFPPQFGCGRARTNLDFGHFGPAKSAFWEIMEVVFLKRHSAERKGEKRFPSLLGPDATNATTSSFSTVALFLLPRAK